MKQPPIPRPRSFSVAPAPRMTERAMAAMHRILEGRSFANIEEANAFLNSPEGIDTIGTPSSQPTTSLGKAQEAAYDAWEAEGPERYRLARHALALDPRCGDAWLILAEEERSWRKQRRCFERAVEATERAARDEGWLDVPPAGEDEEDRPPGLYRRHVGLRPYVRARIALARCLGDGGYPQEARLLYDDLLARDRDDPMGVRYEVLPLYHEMGDLPALEALLDRYREDETCCLSYERLWLALAQERMGEVKKIARRAEKANPHVPEHLLGMGRVDPTVESITLGSEEEAAFYAAMSRKWWAETPAAIQWLTLYVQVKEWRREKAAGKGRKGAGGAGDRPGREGQGGTTSRTRQRRPAYSVYQMKVTLRGAKPPIWRRFLVRDDITLAELHETLQVVMGWTNTHLYRFEIDGEEYSEPDPFEEQWYTSAMRDARKVKLRKVIGGEGARFRYEYDFGDGWEHTVTVERVLPPEAGAVYPVCLKGKRACPPEDCGGIWGYLDLLDILADPADPEHGKMTRWLGRPFDPEAFDLAGVNEALRRPFLIDWDEV